MLSLLTWYEVVTTGVRYPSAPGYLRCGFDYRHPRYGGLTFQGQRKNCYL
jgi:hypothetical protein